MTPLYRDTQAFCAVLLEALEGETDFIPLRHTLMSESLALQATIVQALAGTLRAEHLDEADALLCTLHARLALAHYLGLLGDEVFTALTSCANRIGRQLGGWLRKLRSASEHPIN